MLCLDCLSQYYQETSLEYNPWKYNISTHARRMRAEHWEKCKKLGEVKDPCNLQVAKFPITFCLFNFLSFRLFDVSCIFPKCEHEMFIWSRISGETCWKNWLCLQEGGSVGHEGRGVLEVDPVGQVPLLLLLLHPPVQDNQIQRKERAGGTNCQKSVGFNIYRYFSETIPVYIDTCSVIFTFCEGTGTLNALPHFLGSEEKNSQP